jgi:hypothetical protein
MNRSARIFRMVARDLPGVSLCRDMLVVVPTEWIVRGFLLETTTEKDRIYFWRVVAPLYRPMTAVPLIYGDRISMGGEDIYIDRSAFEKSAAAIRSIIVEGGHLEYLQKIRTPLEFLQHASWVSDESPILPRLDRALTRYLVGDERQSFAVIKNLGSEIDRLDNKRQEYVGPLIKRVALEIEERPLGLKSLLEKWASENIERLGLQSSRNVSV